MAALKKERSRFEHAVKINGEETDVECADAGVRERDGEGVRQREREKERERYGERGGDRAREIDVARVRRSSPGMRSVEFPTHSLRPAPSPPDRRQESR